MIALVGSTPKYRPSSESADCQFMRKTSPSAMTRQPCQIGQRSTAAVALARLAHLDLVDRDGELISANRLPGKRQHALQHRHAARQIAAICEECRERFGRLDRDKFGDSKSAGRLQPVETDGHAFGSVP